MLLCTRNIIFFGKYNIDFHASSYGETVSGLLKFVR